MALAECGTRAIVAAVPGGARVGERTLAAGLVDKIEPDMLVTADAGLYSWELFNSFADTGAELLWRIGASVSIEHLRWLADGSYLALIYRPGLAADRRTRLAAAAKTGAEVPAELARLVRVVEYTVPDRNPDGELIAVITTMLDPHQVDALELAAAYPQRWDEESAIDEVKTDLRGCGQVLRSQSPKLVEQELWGLLLAHYGIRALLVDAADEAGYDPDRTSFIRGLRVEHGTTIDTKERSFASTVQVALLRHNYSSPEGYSRLRVLAGKGVIQIRIADESGVSPDRLCPRLIAFTQREHPIVR